MLNNTVKDLNEGFIGINGDVTNLDDLESAYKLTERVTTFT
jgi:hypothetical protein